MVDWQVCGAYRVGGQTLKGHFASPNAFSFSITHGGTEPWAIWGSGDEVNFLLLCEHSPRPPWAMEGTCWVSLNNNSGTHWADGTGLEALLE